VPHPLVGLDGENLPGPARQRAGEQARPGGQVDRDGAASGTSQSTAAGAGPGRTRS
jgi:hypothetical protein